MEGKRIISLMGRFVEEIGADVDRFLYDGDVFGNYDVVLNYKGISLALNCDRGYLSVLVSGTRKQRDPVEYSKILARTSAGHQYDLDCFRDHERLAEVLSVVRVTVDLVREQCSETIRS